MLHWRGWLKIAAVLVGAVTVCGEARSPRRRRRASASSTSARSATSGWTYQHDLGRKEMEKALAGKVTTKYVENVAEGADAERVIRELAQSGCRVVYATSFGYMNYIEKVAKQFPEGHVHARDRLQDRTELRHLQRALLRRPLSQRRDRRQDDQEQHHRLRRRVSDPRGAAGHQRLHARRAQRQPQGRSARDLGELVVRPGQGARGGQHAAFAGGGRRHQSHRLDRRRPGRRGEGQVRGRATTPTCRSTGRRRSSPPRRTSGATSTPRRRATCSPARGRRRTSGAA